MNAPQLVDKFLHEQWYHIEADLTPHDKKQLAELLLIIWEQSRKKHDRADDVWYIDEQTTYGVQLTRQEFEVTYSETIPGGDKK